MKSKLPTAAPRKRSFWRTCRLYFRGFRIAVWILVLFLLSALICFNQIGLPGFLKKALLANLSARGLDLQFSRVHLSWSRGLVAENVRFGRADAPLSPQLTAAQVQVRLNARALARLRLQVDSLALRRGRLVVPLAETNQPSRELAVENIQTDLHFLPDDEWALDRFTAQFAGAKIQLSGRVAHASAVRDWKILEHKPGAPPGAWRNRLRQWKDLLERMQFSSPPVLRLDVRGDARDFASFGVRVLLITPGADTPWGIVNHGRLSARLFPATTNGLSSAEVSLEAADAQTRWATAQSLQLTAHLASFASLTNLGNGEVTLCASRLETKWGRAANVQLTAHGASVQGQTNLISADVALLAGDVRTKWGAATNAQFEARWIHALTNAVPLGGEAKLRCSRPDTLWGAAKELRLNLRMPTPPTTVPLRGDESWAGWARLEPYALDWEGRASELRSHQVQVDSIACGGSWRAPELTITNLHAELDQRALDLRAGLNVASRALNLSLASGIDPHRLTPVLPEEARHWLADFSWQQPPQVKGDLSLILPAWTNRQPDWRAEVQPTLQLRGAFNTAHGGAYRGVSVTAVEGHVSYSNRVWRLPDLTVTRPEGQLHVAHIEDERTRDFYFRIASTLDVKILRPLLNAKEQKGLDYFTFTQPPVIDAELWGRWHEPERTGLKGRVELTNFTFRGESASGLQTALQYTNRFLQFIAPRIQRGAQQATADGLGADFASQLVYLTNGYSTAEPMFIARAIGPHVARAIEPYQFRQPPVAHVHGTIPMHGEDDADLHFDLDGGPFDWWRFHLGRVVGHVHWLGQHLSLTNVHADFYSGQAAGSASFDFHPHHETNYRFNVAVTDARLQPLTQDLFLTTNQLDGWLNGTLVITNASTADLRSWNGYGDLALRDGLIWDIPLFGIFSGVLNGMVPGLGSSRASAGTCTCVITNGVIRSEDLDIRSTGMRLDYRGTLDFEGQVHARVEAELLRDMPLFGPVFSTVLWPVTKIFEFKVSGTLSDPKAQPVYLIPKVMLLPFQMPFHPIRTLKGLLPENLGTGSTNAPPLTAPKQE